MKLRRIFPVLFFALLSVSAKAEIETGLEVQGRVLGMLAEDDSLPEDIRNDLLAVLTGQSYESRVSILEGICAGEDNSNGVNKATCDFKIGRDDTTDSDSGWGYVYNINAEILVNVKTGTVKIKKVSHQGLAG